ncbi:MAG TPA: hypothetical protein PLZ57_13750 [Pseudobdellovibrionaceae bacterium]|nr:hypothetical protein [Pseudobdellovibrionaceae bacterium]
MQITLWTVSMSRSIEKSCRFGLVLGSLFVALVLGSTTAWAHGEDHAGPNGGEIRMPGGFHVEAKLVGTQLKVWLLDINIKNPSVKNSNLVAEIVPTAGKAKTLRGKCQAATDHFVCDFSREAYAQSKLVVKATREGSKGQDAVYALPLKF